MKSSSQEDPLPNDDFLQKARDAFLQSETPFPRSLGRNKESIQAHGYLFPIDETEEFYDPFSDLNLFLSQKVKEKMDAEKTPKKWSRHIQSSLLKEILPDFSKAFPKYRLGISALKKTWDKVFAHMQILSSQKEMWDDKGKINVHGLIRENLKYLLENVRSLDQHPYNMAHNVSIKISECIALLEGVRPNLEMLTKMIWAIQKHLVPKNPSQSPCHFERYDALDKLIARFQLEEVAKNPFLSEKELSYNIKKKVEHLKDLEKIKNIEELSTFIHAILAEKLYPTLKIHKNETKEAIHAYMAFIRHEIQKHHQWGYLKEEKDRLHFTYKIVFLARLASQLSEEEVFHNLQIAIDYVYNLSTHAFQPKTPLLHPEVYTFIDSEILMLKDHKVDNPLEHVLSTLLAIFSEAKKLPLLQDGSYKDLEILVWKLIEEELNVLHNLPLYKKQMIISELANIHIDHPEETFSKLIQISLYYLKKVRDIEISQLDDKVKIWSLQNDMIHKQIHFDQDAPLLKVIRRLWKSHKGLSVEEFVGKSVHSYTKLHPALESQYAELKIRALILFKHFWYNELSRPNESSYDRFLKWHIYASYHNTSPEFSEMILQRLSSLIKDLLPLAPFSQKYCRGLVQESEEFFSCKKEDTTQAPSSAS